MANEFWMKINMAENMLAAGLYADELMNEEELMLLMEEFEEKVPIFQY